MKNSILIIILFILLSPLFGRGYSFEKVKIHAGDILSIFQDSEGYIWFGTKQGLLKYYGNTCKKYSHLSDDATSISNNYIRCIAEDQHNNLWIGTNYGINCFNRKKEEFKVFIPDSSTNGLPTNEIRDIQVDKTGKIWFGTIDGLYSISEEVTGRPVIKRHIPEKTTNWGSTPFSVWDLYESSDGILWLGTLKGLCRADPENPAIELFVPEYDSDIPNAKLICSVEEFEPGILIIGSFGGLTYFFDTKKKQYFNHKEFSDFATDTDIQIGSINSLLKIDNELWMAGSQGLFVVDVKNYQLLFSSNKYKHRAKSNNIFKDQALTLCYDKQGIIWVSYGKLGLEKCDLQKINFNEYFIELDSEYPYRDYITKIIPQKNYLWISTWGDGLIHAEKDGHIINRIKFSNQFQNTITSFIIDRKGIFWLGTANGLLQYAPRKNKILNVFTKNSGGEIKLAHNHVMEIIEESEDTLWIITQEGTHKINTSDLTPIYDTLVRIANTNLHSSMLIDSENDYLFGFINSFLHIKVNTKNESISFDKKRKFLYGRYLKTIIQDSKDRYWIATNNGLGRYIYEKDTIIFYDQKEGFEINQIYKIIEDHDGNLWLSGINGLSKFNVDSTKFITFDKSSGLSKKVVKLFIDNKGFIYYAGEGGFYYFHPDSIKLKRMRVPLYLTDIQLWGEPVPVHSPPLNGTPLQYKKRLDLDYDQNTLSFAFHALDYSSPENINYSYKLIGSDTAWKNIGTKNDLSFQNLYPGHYKLFIKASDSYQLLSTNLIELDIIIHPPFWLTYQAYAVYVTLIIAMGILLRFIIIKREQQKLKIKLERAENERIHEMDEMKLRFFINISHEIRTPLTLIYGPLELIKKYFADKSSFPPEIHSKVSDCLSLISQNIKRVERFANQVIDIRKLEAGKLIPKVMYADFKVFLDKILNSLISHANNLAINIQVSVQLQSPLLFFSPESIEKILFNILMNSIKYTPENGNIFFECNEIVADEVVNLTGKFTGNTVRITKEVPVIENCRYLQFIIKDTGQGIEPTEIKAIFERYYQSGLKNNSTKGFGIGLSVTKNLVELLKGELFIESYPDVGTTFFIFLPVGQEAYPNIKPVESSIDNSKSTEQLTINLSDSSLPSLDRGIQLVQPKENTQSINILLVEDDKQLLRYISGILQENHTIFAASNGEDAFEIALEEKLDLIISDIMMPVMDGLELCKKIKSDIRTSHISVILLTAKSSAEFEIEGLKTGADDYIPKPFHPDVLILRISNLIESRKKIWNEIAKNKKIIPEGIHINETEDSFLKRIARIIEENINDPNLNQETICREIGLSRTHLYRKLRYLTNNTVNEFIKNVRLKKAAIILSSGEKLRINEVAYSTGFSAPSYFIKMFKNKYGMTPKAYNEKYNKL